MIDTAIKKTTSSPARESLEISINEVTQQKQSVEVKKFELLSIHKAMVDSFHHIEDINCPICVDYIMGCRVAVCGHTFCN